MPSPSKGEKQKEFISRCMGSGEARNSFPDQKQRAAFCYSQWRRKNKTTKIAHGEPIEVGINSLLTTKDHL